MEQVPPAFKSLKETALNSLDRSPKGSIDTSFIPVLDIINASKYHFTTSCCSGRISVFDESHGGSLHEGNEQVRKGKGFGTWLFVSHEIVEKERWDNEEKVLRLLFGDESKIESYNDLDSQPKEGEKLVYFKFEPLVSTYRFDTSSLTAQSMINEYLNSFSTRHLQAFLRLRKSFRKSSIQALGIRVLQPPHLFKITTNLPRRKTITESISR
jgi:hypothetical protein